MAEVKTTVSKVPLNWAYNPTWKTQCQMALIKEGLRGVVSGTEVAPAQEILESMQNLWQEEITH